MKFSAAIAKYAAHENIMTWEAVRAASHEKKRSQICISMSKNAHKSLGI